MAQYHKRTINSRLISRDHYFDLNQQHSCNPTQRCKKKCTPACSSDQACTYREVTECGTCPPTYCIDKSQLQVSATDFDANTISNNNHQRTALIAGLTSGLVVLALIAVTIAGFVFHRRRKLQKLLSRQQEEDEKKAYQPLHPPVIVSHIHHVLPPPSPLPPAITALPPISELNQWNQQQAMDYVDYDHPQSPFIIGAQSLQIPHLDTPDPSINTTLTRRSLNIQPTTVADNSDYLSRAASVKVTKYDNRPIPIAAHMNIHDDDDDEGETKIRRAVSVKKNNSTGSHSSSITRVGSITSEDVKVVCAKPTVVRINTITSKENGITRKRSVRTVIEPFQVSLQDPPSADLDENTPVDIYFYPTRPPNVYNPSQVSIQSSESTSTVGDGEITVYWEPGPSP